MPAQVCRTRSRGLSTSAYVLTRQVGIPPLAAHLNLAEKKPFAAKLRAIIFRCDLLCESSAINALEYM